MAFFIKQGGLLQLNLAVQQDDSTPVDVTGAALFSEIRDQYGALVATPVLTITDAPNGLISYAAQSDATWPTGQVKSDLYIQLAGVPFFTQTFSVTVGAPVSQLADRH